ncbi:MAG: AgmX/PglI C-terminal domain-containing protein [Deltaproteobacteria bacterium]|nr:AgmX/PglI C-terminal domain-containing protein [Deltaproteobacteria bacterium]
MEAIIAMRRTLFSISVLGALGATSAFEPSTLGEEPRRLPNEIIGTYSGEKFTEIKETGKSKCTQQYAKSISFSIGDLGSISWTGYSFANHVCADEKNAPIPYTCISSGSGKASHFTKDRAVYFGQVDSKTAPMNRKFKIWKCGHRKVYIDSNVNVKLPLCRYMGMEPDLREWRIADMICNKSTDFDELAEGTIVFQKNGSIKLPVTVGTRTDMVLKKVDTEPAELTEEEKQARVEEIGKSIPDLSWETFNKFYSLNSPAPPKERQRLWQYYAGKRVKWTGYIGAINRGVEAERAMASGARSIAAARAFVRNQKRILFIMEPSSSRSVDVELDATEFLYKLMKSKSRELEKEAVERETALIEQLKAAGLDVPAGSHPVALPNGQFAWSVEPATLNEEDLFSALGIKQGQKVKFEGTLHSYGDSVNEIDDSPIILTDGVIITEGKEEKREKHVVDNTLIPQERALLPGQLTRDQIFKTITASNARFKECISKHAISDPDLQGRMIISFEIYPTGYAEKLTVANRKYQETAVADCVTGVLKGLNFGMFKSDPIFIEFPFIISQPSSK